MLQKGSALLIVLLLLVLFVGGVGYYFYSQGYFKNMIPQTQQAQTEGVFNDSAPVTTNNKPSQVAQTTSESGNVISSDIKLSVIYPSNNASLTSLNITVTGKTSPNAEVFINDQSAKADASGNFSLKITLDEGQNGLVVIANDDLGNVAEQDILVNVASF
jgi:hypothetical protein